MIYLGVRVSDHMMTIGICVNARTCVSTYISTGMLNCIQEQVPLMSQLTAQIGSQSLRHYALSQLHNNATAVTSLLHHHHYIRSCQTSLSMLQRLMLNC